MSETSLQKIDKYYLGLAIVLVLMSVLLIFSFQGVFSAFLTASDVDPANADVQVRVMQSELDEAYNWAFNKTPTKLEVN